MTPTALLCIACLALATAPSAARAAAPPAAAPPTLAALVEEIDGRVAITSLRTRATTGGAVAHLEREVKRAGRETVRVAPIADTAAGAPDLQAACAPQAVGGAIVTGATTRDGHLFHSAAVYRCDGKLLGHILWNDEDDQHRAGRLLVRAGILALPVAAVVGAILVARNSCSVFGLTDGKGYDDCEKTTYVAPAVIAGAAVGSIILGTVLKRSARRRLDAFPVAMPHGAGLALHLRY